MAVRTNKTIGTVVDFKQSPYLLLWELTRACALACRHCRAQAIRNRNPHELVTSECLNLMKLMRGFGQPLIVLTGGDPVERPDVFELIEEAGKLGFSVAMTPSGTPSVTKAMVGKFSKSGLARMAISLDGPDEDSHDSFRQVKGSFRWTTSIISWALEFGLPVQINTTLTRHNLDRFKEMADLVGHLGAVLWSVFFLVPVGRARQDMQISAAQAEVVLNKMADLSQTASYDVKSTAAPHFRRVLLERFAAGSQAESSSIGSSLKGINPALNLGSIRSYQSVNDGKGVLFVSHTGDIYPSGFLPIATGNVRHDSIISIYRENKVFQELRDPSRLKGKCGLCRYRAVCGGSRARAYAQTGDYLQQDKLCSFYDKDADTEKTLQA